MSFTATKNAPEKELIGNYQWLKSILINLFHSISELTAEEEKKSYFNIKSYWEC